MQKRLKTLLIIALTVLSASLSAQPIGYSVNSDSPSDLSDGLYEINLSTGVAIDRIGTVQTTLLQKRLDVEGLAFAADGTLYGVDDDRLKLFAIQLDNHALIDPDRDYDLSGLSNGGNDFGMTFACDENLYITSVDDQSLYRVGPEGKTVLVGGPEKGKLKADISALAAYGFPVQLYGLGSGSVGDSPPAAPNTLYLIDTASGTATELGTLNGASFGAYESAGLAFDTNGLLWAMTDRRPSDLPSQVMRVDKTNALVSNVSTITADTGEEAWGFESLAIAPPAGCTPTLEGPFATVYVQKRFTDGNNDSPVTLHFQCSAGNVSPSSKTLFPDEFTFGIHETTFQVYNLPEGPPVICEVWEEVPSGYTAEYSCQSDTTCTANQESEPTHCVFTDVEVGQQNLCLIDNNVAPVEITVTKEWFDNITPELTEEESDDDVGVKQFARIDLICENVHDGDGTQRKGKGRMRWSWEFEGNPASHVATVYPLYDETTECWTQERNLPSAVESESTCSDPTPVLLGDEELECDVSNFVFFEGIPTLNQYGLILITALMLLTGVVAMRRFS